MNFYYKGVIHNPSIDCSAHINVRGIDVVVLVLSVSRDRLQLRPVIII